MVDSPPTHADFESFVQSHVAVVEPLHRQLGEAWWMASTTGLEEHQKESARVDSALRRVYSDPEEYRFVKAMDESGTLADPLLRRQARLLSQSYLANQMPPEEIDRTVALEKEIESDFNNHRALVDGQPVTDNQIKDILRNEHSAERRIQAWEGSKQIGARVVERVLRLVEMRNENARRLGFADFYQMQLVLQDLDPDRLFDVLGSLERLTDEPWRRYKAGLDAVLSARHGVSLDELRPWHYADPFFQELPRAGDFDLDPWLAGRSTEDLTRTFFARIGLEVDDILARSDLYERPGKCQHAFCISIDRADDVRVLANVTPDEYWTATMLHELGHAVYDKHVDRGLPFLLREPAHILFTEAVAMFMGRLTKDARWLRHYLAMPEDVLREVEATLTLQLSQQLLVFVRWGLVVAWFERSMYGDPSQDLNRLWWDLVERFQGLRRPDGRNQPDWAAKIHLATVPAYYQNYILGEMVASQMLARLEKSVLAGDREALVTDPRVGEWFREHVFRPGSSRHWEDVLEAATGERLEPGHLVELVAAAGR